MKNTENNKKLYRRYLDDLYTTEDARQLLNSLHDPDNLNRFFLSNNTYMIVNA